MSIINGGLFQQNLFETQKKIMSKLIRDVIIQNISPWNILLYSRLADHWCQYIGGPVRKQCRSKRRRIKCNMPNTPANVNQLGMLIKLQRRRGSKNGDFECWSVSNKHLSTHTSRTHTPPRLPWEPWYSLSKPLDKEKSYLQMAITYSPRIPPIVFSIIPPLSWKCHSKSKA